MPQFKAFRAQVEAGVLTVTLDATGRASRRRSQGPSGDLSRAEPPRKLAGPRPFSGKASKVDSVLPGCRPRMN